MVNNDSQLNPVLASQLSLERLREYLAGALALLIVLAMMIMAVIAVQNLPNAETFQRAKDLLLVINPFVGVVIGYYFNKVTSDARASALQRVADAAAQAATTASTERERAVQQAENAQEQTNKMRGALTEMVSAVENAGAATPGNLGTLAPKDGTPLSQNQIDFQLALERAKRVLNAS